MSIDNKFTLTKTMKKEGLTLVIHWHGGVSLVKTEKGVQRVQKTVQGRHQISSTVIKNWLSTPTSGYWKEGQWQKKSESERIRLHLLDFIRTMSQDRYLYHSWHIQENG